MYGYLWSILHISASLFKLSSCCLSQEKNMRKAPGEMQPSKNHYPKNAALCFQAARAARVRDGY